MKKEIKTVLGASDDSCLQERLTLSVDNGRFYFGVYYSDVLESSYVDFSGSFEQAKLIRDFLNEYIENV